MVTHAIHDGRTLCNLSELPEGHRGAELGEKPTCPGCIVGPHHGDGGDWWCCHICRQARPNVLIKVVRHPFVLPNGVIWQENVRYCADVPACFEGALERSFLPGHILDELGIVKGKI